MALGYFRRLPLPPPQLAPLVRPPSAKEAKKGKNSPPNTGLWTEESLAALQRFLRDLWSALEGGLPAGRSTIAPSRVEAGANADVGSADTGWSTGSHVHSILTGAAGSVTLGTSAAEGASPSLTRSDHVHETITLLAQIRNEISLRC